MSSRGTFAGGQRLHFAFSPAGRQSLAAAERVGIELPAEYRQMTSEPRSGDLLPEHLVAQQRLNGDEG